MPMTSILETDLKTIDKGRNWNERLRVTHSLRKDLHPENTPVGDSSYVVLVQFPPLPKKEFRN